MFKVYNKSTKTTSLRSFLGLSMSTLWYKTLTNHSRINFNHSFYYFLRIFCVNISRRNIMKIFRLPLLSMLLWYIIIYGVRINRNALNKAQNFCLSLELELPYMEFDFKLFFGNILTQILHTKTYERFT